MKKLMVTLLAAGIFSSAIAEKKREFFKWPGKGKTYVYKQTPGYVTPRGEVRNELEVFFPKDHDPSKKAVPGIMIFHGGGWVGGTRGCHRYLCEYFASRGLVAATASYRVPVERKTSADKRMGVIDDRQSH